MGRTTRLLPYSWGGVMFPGVQVVDNPTNRRGICRAIYLTCCWYCESCEFSFAILLFMVGRRHNATGTAAGDNMWITGDGTITIYPRIRRRQYFRRRQSRDDCGHAICWVKTRQLSPPPPPLEAYLCARYTLFVATRDASNRQKVKKTRKVREWRRSTLHHPTPMRVSKSEKVDEGQFRNNSSSLIGFFLHAVQATLLLVVQSKSWVFD